MHRYLELDGHEGKTKLRAFHSKAPPPRRHRERMWGHKLWVVG